MFSIGFAAVTGLIGWLFRFRIGVLVASVFVWVFSLLSKVFKSV